MIRILLFVLCALVALPVPAQARDWDSFLSTVRARALDAGVSASVVDDALASATFDASVIQKDRKQPEKTIAFRTYRKNVVTQKRIDEGRAMLARYRSTLDRISDQYGVPPQYLVAFWGIESSYGEIQGKHELVTALASLAYDGRRKEFFMKELIATLKIMDDQGRSADQMLGSWAGAMGMVQFMPTTYLRFAADGDGDGKKDIWDTPADAFASAANYLSQSGWQADLRWGRAVALPSDFPRSMTGRGRRYALDVLASRGVTLPDGSDLPQYDLKASIIVPDGLSGPAFLVYDNYRVIMEWNRSDYFATCVGLLADAIADE